MTEQEYVVSQFHKAFCLSKAIPTVIYGLGKNTEAVLKSLDSDPACCGIIGLMDSKNDGKTFLGLEVLSDEIVRSKNARIIIIARESVVPIIFERIEYLNTENGIEIYDFKGERLRRNTISCDCSNSSYWKTSEEQLLREIDKHEVISFDVFDTLIMRRVLEPSDIFEIVEQTAKVIGFAEKRKQVDSALLTMKEIYEQVSVECALTPKQAARVQEIEIETECKYLVERAKMLEIFNYAKEKKKKIYIVSDMYLSAAQMRNMLRICGYEGYEEIIVSSEYKRTKENGSLYEVLKKKCGKQSKILHVGDNRRSDGEMAQEAGIDSFIIGSAYELWMASSMKGTLARVYGLRQRLLLAQVIYSVCNNPFSLSKSKGVVKVINPEELGYLVGPVFSELIEWMVDVLKEKGINQLLLPSRDGYLIQRLLNCGEKKGLMPTLDYKYFKASRRAVSIAAVQTDDDVYRLAERKFEGSVGEMIQKRFGVFVGEEKYALSVDRKSIIARCMPEIRNEAKKEREEYLKYLEKNEVCANEPTAIFDFVATGTVQYYLQKILNKDLVGLYAATMNHPNPDYNLEKCITSAYGNILSYASEKKVGKYYLFLEPIMTDGFNTLVCISDGEPIYEKLETISECENEKKFPIIDRVQEGILSYFSDVLEFVDLPQEEDKNTTAEIEFADAFFGRLMEGGIEIEEEVKKAFVNDDSFDGIKAFRIS